MDSGNYVAGALALESSDMNTAGFAMFRIKPKPDGVRMYWAQQAEQPMTAEELEAFNEAAVLEVDGQVVPTDKIRYTYKKQGWFTESHQRAAHRAGHLYADGRDRRQLHLQQDQPQYHRKVML